MLEQLYDSLVNAPVVKRGNYSYFIHPVSDGVPLLEPSLLEEISEYILRYAEMDVDRIVTVEAMGIPIATCLSLKTGIPLSIVRKRKYDLAGEIELSQSTGYSKGKLYVNGISEGDRVLIVDDVISTGGTLLVLVKALEDAGVEISDVVAVIERGTGSNDLRDAGIDVKTLVRVEIDDDRVVVEEVYSGNE